MPKERNRGVGGKWSAEIMTRAIREINNNGMSVNKVSIQFDIPR